MYEWARDNPALAALTIAVLFFLGMLVAYIFARLVLSSFDTAARYEQPITTMMVILGVISVVALIGALITRAEPAFTIAATGVGAFAGALTARAQAVPNRDDEALPEHEREILEEDQ